MDHIISALVWRKSSQSAQQDNCVETAVLPGGSCAVRNSKDPFGPMLVFKSNVWQAFVCDVKNGAFDSLGC
ncbi:DUF397 domain-containing protein [Streptosporangium sp. G12]